MKPHILGLANGGRLRLRKLQRWYGMPKSCATIPLLTDLHILGWRPDQLAERCSRMATTARYEPEQFLHANLTFILYDEVPVGQWAQARIIRTAPITALLDKGL